MIDQAMVNQLYECQVIDPRGEATGDRMSDEEQAALYRHYGVGPQGGRGMGQHQPGSPDGGRRAQGTGAMTRSEEQLKIGTEQVETGRVRLVKHVVTEEQQVSVPVSHEEVRIEREPITGANRDAAMRGQDITEAEHEVTLHAEKPVVDKETVPVERVALTKETVTDQETVSGTVRKEHIDVEDSRKKR